MEKLFLNNIEKNFSSLLNNKFIVAVSGGVDSIVLLHLCRKLKLNFVVAHCNFKLRGKESDNDELFVKNLVAEYKIKFYSNSFNTEELSSISNKSVQMIARDLRYHWFNELSEDLGIKYILTAHHIDDSIETFLINLSRGSGLDGLLGIPEVNNKVNRPLLIFTKDQIKSYAIKNKISFREDSSNKKRDYLRNQIRLDLIPSIKKINKNFLDNFKKSIEFLKISNKVIKERIDLLLDDISHKSRGSIHFNIEKIKSLSNPKAYLYYFLRDYGFNNWGDILNLLDAQSGKKVETQEFELIKDRDYLILCKKVNLDTFQEITINNFNEDIDISTHILRFKEMRRAVKSDYNFLSQFGVDSSNTRVFVDKDKLIFPLLLRLARPGDYFYPFGMKGKKKISKFLKDEKISIIDKRNILVIENFNKEIVFVLGKRLDNRYGFDSNTQNILMIDLISKDS